MTPGYHCSWAPGGGVSPQYAPNSTRLIAETGTPSTVERVETRDSGTGWTSVDTDGLWVGKYDTTLSIPSGSNVTFRTRLAADMSVEWYDDSGTTDDKIGSLTADIILKVITESFTLGTLTRSGLESLTGPTTTISIMGRREPAGSGLNIYGQSYQALCGRFISLSGSSVYGIAVYPAPNFVLGDGSGVIAGTPRREVRFPPGASYTSDLALLALHSDTVTTQ